MALSENRYCPDQRGHVDSHSWVFGAIPRTLHTQTAGFWVQQALGASDPQSKTLPVRANSSCFWLRGRLVEAFQHEVHEGVPTVKAQVAGQGFDVVEQAFARGQLLAQ